MRLSKFTLIDDAAGSAEAAALAARFNATTRPYPRDRGVADLFAEQAARTPQAVALSRGGRAVTYAELDRRANRLARYLRARLPDCRGRLIALALPRSVDLIVAMLATLKAGAGYLPLDPAYPAARRDLIVSHSGALAVIDRDGGTDDAAPPPVRRIRLDAERSAIDAGPDDTPPVTAAGGELAYVMYTSGSTGRPKAVAVPHRAVVRLVRNADYADFSPDRIFLQYAPAAFDAATFEIWGPLLNGARLALAPEGRLGPRELGAVIADEGVTTLWLTAGLFNLMMDEHPEGLHPLKQLLVGGEALSVAHIRRALELLPKCALVNGYGPTENTTFSCCFPIAPGDYRGSIPIGRPIANSTAYVLDEERRPLPPGTAGELYLGGDGLALGYWNDPELTAERFVASPALPGERLYRSGDLACWRSDGTIEFLGRLDDQIKIRGFRIEPGEIEEALLRYPGVTAAVALAREIAPGRRELVAYVAASEAIGTGDLHRHLGATLPDFMVPAHIVRLDALPLNANGKVDRAALPLPAASNPDGAQPPEPPASETETSLVSLWERVLDRERIGVTDDFFALGGHSLTAAKLVSLIAGELGVALPLASIFTHPTIRSQAEAILDAARFGIDALDRPRVLLNAPRGGRPLFALPPGTSDTLGYARLAAGLDGVDVHAFNFIEAETRIADIADLIAEVQPEGPVLLFGYSGGGNIAFQVTSELERRGRTVSDIVMLDASRFLRPFAFPPEEADRLADSFLADESVAAAVGTGVLRDKARRRIRRYYAYLSSLSEDRPVAADIHLIRSAGGADEHRDAAGTVLSSQSAWVEATTGRFTACNGAGGHGEMLIEPHFSANLALLQAVLARTGRSA
ncbi:amino acid adenylation domain-containing protein [Thalassobaculum sp. OXR-137]|uniref:amino acid adenylation domain-containing protein n=1 Tax=Thalassobaculum sp. OXR-137 TaxID=3100173 RepID=UPI002AC990AC|nr:amino acid adenylation domain-containing protein [Thalassobaculum sp. OXR-137]WPZ32672.1 amino acid adenylation domain-containing protein [Thalassobaculum sp. OXR-137]